MSTILITGAGGRIGTVLRSGLARDGRTLRLLDRVEITGAGPGEEVVGGDLRHLDDALAAARGADAIVHLAGLPDEAPFEEILEHNVRATYHVFEAARRQGARRLVFASTNHVVGFYPEERPLTPDVPPRPDTYYGVSKVFGEALGRLYHDKWGLEVVCLRIGSFRPEPEDERQLSTWLSHRDAVHLVDRCLEAPGVGFLVAYGVSANTRGWWHNGEAAEVLGYAPADDAERFAGSVTPVATPAAGTPRQGGGFTAPDYRGGAA